MSPEIIPQGGTIRETVIWDAVVGVGTHPFYLFSIYGVGTTGTEIMGSQLMAHWFVETVSNGTITTDINASVPFDAPIGTYSCLTIIAENFDSTTNTIEGIYDLKVDTNILTVIVSLGAIITSTSFMTI